MVQSSGFWKYKPSRAGLLLGTCSSSRGISSWKLTNGPVWFSQCVFIQLETELKQPQRVK